jgi:dCMP deaminase
MNKVWRQRYMKLAIEVGEFSEDTSTKVGSYIVNPLTNRPVSFGYNGLPSGVLNKPERHVPPVKYFYFEHAERNAIYNADRQLDGTAIFVTHTPCTDCTRAILQNRISELYILSDNGFDSEWTATRYSLEQLEAIRCMLSEAQIKMFEIHRNGDLA